MDPATAGRAFEPFFSTKTKGEGSGLGLATVYAIVTHAGGSVEINSEAGTGTSVQVFIPETDAALEVAGAAEPSTSPRRHQTILLVEDEPALRDVMLTILSRNGYDVLIALGGAEAIAISLTHPGELHLLMTAVEMPQMLGKEIAERVVAIRDGISVLYVSGEAQSGLASHRAPAAGGVLLERPFDESRLLAKVREALDGPRPSRDSPAGATNERRLVDSVNATRCDGT
jgi:CheY-like chemotaxis protein